MVSNIEMWVKAQRVIDSCVTHKQLMVARNYFNLCKFTGPDRGYDYISDLLDRWYDKEKEIGLVK